MIKTPFLTASAICGAFLSFALTGPANAADFMCFDLQCEENPGGKYPNGAACWAPSGQTSLVKIPDLQACVDAVTGKQSVTLHVVAQGASGRSVNNWNGGRAVTSYALGAQPLFPESNGYLYYEVGVKPANLPDDLTWLLERPINGSFVATEPMVTVDNVIVLAGGGGSRGRIGNDSINADPTWTPSGAIGGRGGRILGWTIGRSCGENLDYVCAAGWPGQNDGSAGGGGGAFGMSGGATGSYGSKKLDASKMNLLSEGGWGELFGLAANGAYNNRFQYRMMGGEGGQGDGGGGGGGVYDDCGTLQCESNEEVHAAAGGGGGSRARVTSIPNTLPVFEKAARVEFVFDYYDLESMVGYVVVIGGDTLQVTRNTGVPTQLQNFTQFGWHNDTQLFWPTTAIGDELDVRFNAPWASVYNLTLNVTKAPDYGNYKLFLNGVELADANGYAAGVELAAINLGDHTLKAGFNTLTLKIIGKDYRSQNYFAGIDFIELTDLLSGPLSNLALSGTASQYSTADGGVASRAIDNNTSGVWSQNSVTKTTIGSQPYWDLDLRSVRNIQSINVFNRTDCCSYRLKDFHVFVSDMPFAGKNVAASQGQAGVQDNYYAGAAGVSESFAINRTGRYVRVQLGDAVISNENVLSLAEVQVLGN